MGDSDTAEWVDLTIVDKRVTKLRARYAATEFQLSAKPPEEWRERFGTAVDDDEALGQLQRNPGPVIDGDLISWELNEDDVEAGWEIVKAALAVANDGYGRADAARRYKEEQAQERLDARDRKRDELDKKLKSLR